MTLEKEKVYGSPGVYNFEKHLAIGIRNGNGIEAAFTILKLVELSVVDETFCEEITLRLGAAQDSKKGSKTTREKRFTRCLNDMNDRFRELRNQGLVSDQPTILIKARGVMAQTSKVERQDFIQRHIEEFEASQKVIA